MTGNETTLYSAVYAYYANTINLSMNDEEMFRVFERFDAVRKAAFKDYMRSLSEYDAKPRYSV